MNSSVLSSSMLGLLIGFLKWNFLEEKGMECYHDI
jgi:UDP-N-acetylmuramyl pentapeptide phosphotransferase/UDP-N-acetylglucosamine-1-phosphate transferase